MEDAGVEFIDATLGALRFLLRCGAAAFGAQGLHDGF